MERVGEAHISETERQVSFNGGRRETLKPEITGLSKEGRRESWDGVDRVGESWDEVERETKEEAEGERTGEGLDRASATTFSGPGM